MKLILLISSVFMAFNEARVQNSYHGLPIEVKAGFHVSDEPDDKNFMRKGQVGDWKNYFDPEKNKEWNAWIARNISGTDMEQLDHFQISNL